MLAHYLKISARHLLRQPGYTLINVGGLGLGMACVLLLTLYVLSELRFDRFHENAERIVRVESEFPGRGQGIFTDGFVGPSLVQEMPQVEATVRFSRTQHLVSHEERKYYGAKIAFVDSNFFDVFSFELLSGDPKRVLAEPYSLVLTSSMAHTYFGDEDPVGRTVRIDDAEDYRVTGVVADVPPTSHYSFDALGSFSTLLPKRPWLEERGSIAVQTYALLQPTTDLATLDEKMSAYAARFYSSGEGPWLVPRFRPLTDIHLRPNGFELEPQGDVRVVYLFATIAAFILLLAGVNYVNLATARAARRVKEVGLRKVMGAGRGQLIRQFLGESVLVATAAMLLAVALVAEVRPVLAAFLGRMIPLPEGGQGIRFLLLLLAVGMGIGVLAGTYPAFYVTRFLPAEVLKGTYGSYRRGSGLRKVLVVSQFGVSIALLIGTFVIYRQLAFMQTRDLGFDREHIVNVHVRDPQLLKRAESFQERLRSDARIVDVTISSSGVGEFVRSSFVQTFEADEASPEPTVGYIFTDAAFVPTMGIDIVAGHNLPPNAADSSSLVLINEYAARQLGWRDPQEAIGKKLIAGMFERPLTVHGVVRDFHVRSLASGMTPLMLIGERLEDDAVVSVRVRANETRVALAHLEAVWTSLIPEWPFEYTFLDEEIAQRYRRDRQTGRLFGVFAGLAVLIGCLGLFGLAAYTAEQRTKEIGIRKIVGASVTRIVLLLTLQFTTLVLAAVVLAVPFAYLGMERWLEAYAYRIELAWWLFALPALATLALAFLTVSYHAVRAALTDPAITLRSE